jgi:hypothetical protein
MHSLCRLELYGDIAALAHIGASCNPLRWCVKLRSTNNSRCSNGIGFHPHAGAYAKPALAHVLDRNRDGAYVHPLKEFLMSQRLRG